MNFGIKYIFHPTPDKIRTLGDCLLGAFGIGGSLSAVFGTHHTITGIALSIGFLLKIASNMFVEKK